MVKELFNFLIFPGFLFSAVAGLMAGWLDRKVTARIHWRVGPPWYQNFIDIIKLLGKEVIVPEGSNVTFLAAPYLGLLSLILVAAILGKSIISPLESFAGDLIVIVYLLTIPAIALILGGSASRNPLASVGVSREMKMILAYELPFVLSILTVIIKSSGSIRIGQILMHQAGSASNIFSISGLLAFLVAILCMQAKLGFVPFDASEADQEIMCGVLIEYSGLPLAVFKLTKALALYTLPLLLTVLFLGKDTSVLFIIPKFIALLVVVILIKNTSPRLRIEQVLRFFWKIPLLLGVIAVILAVMGY
jgi:NADH-quinone oxidoreductase subunit H